MILQGSEMKNRWCPSRLLGVLIGLKLGEFARTQQLVFVQPYDERAEDITVSELKSIAFALES